MIRRDWLAFALAPLIVALALGLGLVIYDPEMNLGFLGWGAYVTLMFVYPATFALGVPFWFLCKTRWGVTWWRVLLGGAACGTLLPMLLSLMLLLAEFRSGKAAYYLRDIGYAGLEFALQGALIGLCIAILIRLIAGATPIKPSSAAA